MPNRLDNLLTLAVFVAALSITVRTVRNWDEAEAPSREVRAQESLEPAWRDYVGSGLSIGSSTAPLNVVELVDFECSACRQFHRTLSAANSDFEGQIRITYVHYPLGTHRFAVPSAIAVECADQQGRAAPFIDALFASQDSIGLLAWSTLATRAGIEQVDQFEDCRRRPESDFPRIATGRNLGQRLRVEGTPTVILNGIRFQGAPPAAVFHDKIDSLLGRGK